MSQKKSKFKQVKKFIWFGRRYWQRKRYKQTLYDKILGIRRLLRPLEKKSLFPVSGWDFFSPLGRPGFYFIFNYFFFYYSVVLISSSLIWVTTYRNGRSQLDRYFSLLHTLKDIRTLDPIQLKTILYLT